MAYNYIQGKFTPRNPHKYNGDANNVIFRSSWERNAFTFCDETEEIVKWSSEECIIPYVSTVDGKGHRYFVDLQVTVRNAKGEFQTFLVEIKPYAQTKKPKKTPRKTEVRFIEEVKTYMTNMSKWAAAKQYCKERGWEFIIWTEKQLLPTLPKYKRRD